MLELLLSATGARYDELAFLPWVGSHVESIVHNGKLYAAGGLSTTTSSMDNFGVYDFDTNTWRSLAPMPGRARSGAMFARGNYIYFLGGLLQSAGQTSVQLNSVYFYSMTTNTWTTDAYTVPIPLVESAYYQVNETTGLIFGGQTAGGISTVGYTVNIGNGSVSFTPNISLGGNDIRRVRPINVNGELYFCGGSNTAGTPHAGFVKYNLTTKVWTKLADLPISCNSMNVVDKDGKIYIYTTYSPTHGYKLANYVYDIATNTWEEGARVYGRVLALTLGVPYNGVVYSPGGYNGKSRVRRFRYFTPKDNY